MDHSKFSIFIQKHRLQNKTIVDLPRPKPEHRCAKPGRSIEIAADAPQRPLPPPNKTKDDPKTTQRRPKHDPRRPKPTENRPNPNSAHQGKPPQPSPTSPHKSTDPILLQRSMFGKSPYWVQMVTCGDEMMDRWFVETCDTVHARIPLPILQAGGSYLDFTKELPDCRNEWTILQYHG